LFTGYTAQYRVPGTAVSYITTFYYRIIYSIF
jgi:hypothetical protein